MSMIALQIGLKEDAQLMNKQDSSRGILDVLCRATCIYSRTRVTTLV